MNFRLLLLLAFGFTGAVNAQSITAEKVDFRLPVIPKTPIDVANRTFRVKVTSPYTLKTDDIIAQSKVDFQTELKDYEKVVAASEVEYQKKVANYDQDVLKAKEKYKLESEQYKKMTLLERLAVSDQGKDPKLTLPTKPQYIKPLPPVYSQPDLTNYIIVDNAVLESQIQITGFSREGSYVDIAVDIKRMNFQDNAGQTFANQPTKLIVKVNGVEKINTGFFQEFKLLSTSPSNNLNKPLEEKYYLNKVIAHINGFLDDNFGVRWTNPSIMISTVKNKGKYDDLEKASIYVSTNLRKMNPENAEMTAAAMTGMQKGIDIWKDTLTKIDYKDKKADFNAKIATYIYYNLIRLNIALRDKKEAEKYLNELQENMIYLDLSSSEKAELKQFENSIYKG
ncbi:hypothetical protein [Flavobacterium sp.]